MDTNKIEHDISSYAIEYAENLLNLPPYIQQFKTVQMQLKQVQDIGYASPEHLRTMQIAEIRNGIFACIHTTDTHAFYQENLEMLKTHDQKLLRLMCGDTQLELEQVNLGCVARYAEAAEGNDIEAINQTFTQAVGMRVTLNALGDLRQKMADNFGDQDFVNYVNDKKILPI